MGDINVDLRTQAPTNREMEIMALIATLGLEDMSTHFLQCNRFRHGNTWHSMERDSSIIASRTSKCPSNRESNKTHFLVESNINYNKIASTREHKHKYIKSQNGRMNVHPMSPCTFFLFQRGFFSVQDIQENPSLVLGRGNRSPMLLLILERKLYDIKTYN
jgi:hypothetical protein